MIVLDASVAVGWLLGEDSPIAEIQTILDTRQIVVPAHWAVEIGNATLKALRRRMIAEERLLLIEHELGTLSIRVEPPIRLEATRSLVQFARVHGLTMYDGIYVHTALLYQAELATFDSAMRKAASQLGISLWPSYEV